MQLFDSRFEAPTRKHRHCILTDSVIFLNVSNYCTRWRESASALLSGDFLSSRPPWQPIRVGNPCRQVCDCSVRWLVMRNRALRNIENQLTFISARRAGRLR